MDETEEPAINGEEAQIAPPRRRLRLLFALGIIFLAVALGVWVQRKQFADQLISSQLTKLDLPATYKVESIGPRSQVLTNVVIGDPRAPDATVDKVIVVLQVRFGLPGVRRVALIRPRLYGTLRGGKVSFGSLDKILFEGPSTKPFQLPNLDLAVVDGRARLDSDYGIMGFKLEGSGPLRGGFKGALAAVVPNARLQGCSAANATLYGNIGITAERPRFAGPVRLAGLSCPDQALRLEAASLNLDATLDKGLDGVSGKAALLSGRAALGGNRLASAKGSSQFTWRDGSLTARYLIAASAVETAQGKIAGLATSGRLRGQGGNVAAEGDLNAIGLDIGRGLDASIGKALAATRNTLAAPLLARLRAALAREAPGSSLSASYVLRQSGGATSVVLPQGTLRGGSGTVLASLSRFSFTTDGRSPARIAGNIATSGRDLPQIVGRMESGPGGSTALRFVMPEYAAGDSRLAIPGLVLIQGPGGSLGFAGSAQLTGALPGGAARNLLLPLDGNWAPGRGLAVWRKCTALRFDSLALANLTLERQTLTLCPPPGAAIVRSDGRGTRIAAGAPSLAVAGKLGATPIRISGGPVGFAWPGALAARSLDVALGPGDTPSRFRIGNVAAQIGKDIAGTFTGSDVLLAGVPLDLLGADGQWRYANDRLTISDATFRLIDRQPDARFQPLTGTAGRLELTNNVITANARMNEPATGRLVVTADIRHDLASGRGHADLDVPGITFDSALQPDMLTRLALGVVANVSGTVRGTGRIDWDAERVSSTGRFASDGLDLAAAFGPAKGVSGTVEFTDLLGLVTAPNQRLHVASINPGIEVTDGTVDFAMLPGNVLALHGARWPFMGGTMTLQPVRMNLGVAETRRYTLIIDGLEAAKLVQQLELANITATGTFDGQLPLVFDDNGGRIEEGWLHSRPPGGNLSYVGALTYKDLSAMANFAFDTLKSLDFRKMDVEMEGALAGEIITRVKFDGVRQGAGAKRNFLTDRIAKLPIRFNVNIKAPFFQVVHSFRSLYDPAYVRDPRELGLLDANGRPVVAPPQPGLPPNLPIQPSVSETKP